MAKLIKNNIAYNTAPSSAKLLPYDNTESGLTATNVQDAVDEISGSRDLDDLADVTITTPTDGQVLKYDNGTWVNANDDTGVDELSELSDVTISSATSGQILKYNGSKWLRDR